MATDTRRSGSSTLTGGDDAAVLLGGAITVVGAFFPWFTPSTTVVSFESSRVTITGIDMLTGGVPLFSGGVTILFALGACASRLFYDGENGRTLEVLLGVVVFAVALVLFVSPNTAFGGGMRGIAFAGVTDPGIGAIATLLGALGIVGGGLFGYYAR